MLSPDDPRHGTVAGYEAGCRNNCCGIPRARHLKRLRHQRSHGDPSRRPALGARRRIQALQAIGWTCEHIGAKADMPAQQVNAIVSQRQLVQRSAHDRIAAAYDALSMTPGPSNVTRRRAQARGWPPPLAWDDETLDDPDAQPYKVPTTIRALEQHNGRERLRIDPVVVQRALAGQKVKATTAETAEIARRWLADGRSAASLCELQGWRHSRNGLNLSDAA